MKEFGKTIENMKRERTVCRDQGKHSKSKGKAQTNVKGIHIMQLKEILHRLMNFSIKHQCLPYCKYERLFLSSNQNQHVFIAFGLLQVLDKGILQDRTIIGLIYFFHM